MNAAGTAPVAHTAPEAPAVLLASRSPRRAALLRTVGIEPVVAAADVDETPTLTETGLQLVQRLATNKAEVGWETWSRTRAFDDGTPTPTSGWMVIAADTVVEVDDSILGKPEGEAEAERMLRLLSGNAHRVHTGVAVGLAAGMESSLAPIGAVETTDVVMRTLDTDTIAWYIQTGEPLDKAGAYGIQGKGSLLVERIDGSFPNVVGLPIATVDSLCRRLGWPLHHLVNGATSKALR